MTETTNNNLPADNKDVQGTIAFHDSDNMYEKEKIKSSYSLLTKVIPSPLWLSISEAAILGGIQNKTVRRAIQSKAIKYKIVGNRYSVDLASLIKYLHSKTKLMNKLNQYGIGQYIKEWLD